MTLQFSNPVDIRDTDLAYKCYRNFHPTNMRAWRAAVAAVARGGRNAKLACLGDSTTRGSASVVGSGAFFNGYPNQLAPLLATLYGVPAACNNFFGNGNQTALVTAQDSRISATGAWDALAGNQSVGGNVLSSNGTGVFTFTPGAAFDTADIYYAAVANGTQNADLAGGTATLITNTGHTTVTKASITGSLATQAVHLTQVSGNATFFGIDTYNSAQKQINIWNWGYPGSRTVNWSNSASNWQPINAIPVFAPDLTIICLGINDWGAGGEDVPTFTTGLQAIITAALQGGLGSVILMTPNPTQAATVSLATQQLYINAMYALAASNDIPLIDVWSRFGSWEIMNALGMEDTGGTVVHPNGLGYFDIATTITSALRFGA